MTMPNQGPGSSTQNKDFGGIAFSFLEFVLLRTLENFLQIMNHGLSSLAVGPEPGTGRKQPL